MTRRPVSWGPVTEREVARLVRAALASHQAEMSAGQLFQIYLGWRARSMVVVVGAIADVLEAQLDPPADDGAKIEGAD